MATIYRAVLPVRALGVKPGDCVVLDPTGPLTLSLFRSLAERHAPFWAAVRSGALKLEHGARDEPAKEKPAPPPVTITRGPLGLVDQET